MPRLTHVAAVLPALAVIALLAGCAAPALPASAGNGGVVNHSAAPTAPAKVDVSKLDACTMLPESEADTLIGTKLVEPLRASNTDTTSCTYPGDPNGPDRAGRDLHRGRSKAATRHRPGQTEAHLHTADRSRR